MRLSRGHDDGADDDDAEHTYPIKTTSSVTDAAMTPSTTIHVMGTTGMTTVPTTTQSTYPIARNPDRLSGATRASGPPGDPRGAAHLPHRP